MPRLPVAETPSGRGGIPTPSTTPGGLHGTVETNRYQPMAGPPPVAAGPVNRNTAPASVTMGSGRAGAGQFVPTGTPGNVDEFKRYEDAAYDQARARMEPRFAEEQRRAAQQLINQGVDPTSPAGMRYLAQLRQDQNDAYNAAQYGAMGEGRQAQGQAFGQANANDQLRLGYDTSLMSANASMHNANVGAGASRYASDNAYNASIYGNDTQRYLGELGNALGFAGLNEQGRQFDVNDIFRTNNQDLQLLQGLFGMGMGMDQNAAQNYDRNQGYSNNWLNQLGGMFNQASGGIFTPVDVNGAANAQTNAGRGQDAWTTGLLGALGGMPS